MSIRVMSMASKEFIYFLKSVRMCPCAYFLCSMLTLAPTPPSNSLVSMRLWKRWVPTSRRLATTRKRLLLFLSLAGMVTICLNQVRRCHGIKAGQLSARRAMLAARHFSNVWTRSSLQRDLLRSLSDFRYRMCTRLEVCSSCVCVRACVCM